MLKNLKAMGEQIKIARFRKGLEINVTLIIGFLLFYIFFKKRGTNNETNARRI